MPSSAYRFNPTMSSQTVATTRSKDVRDVEAQLEASTASGNALPSTFLRRCHKNSLVVL
jgi:hypothetical protein